MDFKSLADSFLSNRKNANAIITLIKFLQEEEGENVHLCVASLLEVFLQILKRGDLNLDPGLEATNLNDYAVEKKYVEWLTDLYDKFFNRLIRFAVNGGGDIRSQAFGSIFQLLSADTRRQKGIFPLEKFEKLIYHVLSNHETRKENLVEQLAVYLLYRDMLFFCWKVVKDIVIKEENQDDKFIVNLIDLLEKIKPPKDLDSLEMLCSDDVDTFTQSKEELLYRNVQKTWMALINCPLSGTNHRKLLIVLVEGYLSVLPKPTLLTDFLVGSLSIGGATALLALQGMSTLVTKHNLECPNIFGKLYNMFQPDIFYTRYKARLFYLADIFLQSTYVPEQLVAAYAKRLSRLSLVAQSPDLVLIMQFVGNILIRHPSLSIMIHTSPGESVEADPFDMDEVDPLKSKALESSLWELALLKNHVQPKVASAAKFLDGQLPSVEWDIRNELDSSYAVLFAKEMKSKGELALNFVRPTSIKQLSDDRVYKMWSLS